MATGTSQCIVGIVDDDRAVREALGNLLASLGLEVAAFGSAEEFIASAESTKLNCLILDVTLPGMSGPELQRRLVEDRNIVPIIFITANPDQDVRKRALEHGAAAFFYKPIRSDVFLDALRATLG